MSDQLIQPPRRLEKPLTGFLNSYVIIQFQKFLTPGVERETKLTDTCGTRLNIAGGNTKETLSSLVVQDFIGALPSFAMESVKICRFASSTFFSFFAHYIHVKWKHKGNTVY